MKVLLEIEHCVSIFIISKIWGPWLSISVKETVKRTISAENCVNNAMHVRCVPHLFFCGHWLPVLNAGPWFCFCIQKHGNQSVMKNDKNKKPHYCKNECGYKTPLKIVLRAVLKDPDLNDIHIDANFSQNWMRSFHKC